MNPPAPRLTSIDVARGLAALSVAVCHQGYGNGLAHVTGNEAFHWIDWPGGFLAVPLFFVISGFCIHQGGLAQALPADFTRAFFIQRFFRIYPPWLSAVLVAALASHAAGRPVEAGEWIRHLTLTNGFFNDYRLNPVFWSVSVESCLYLLYPAWLALRRRHGLPLALSVGVLVSVLSSAVSWSLQPTPAGPARWFFLNVWSGWLAGALLAEWRHTRAGWLTRPAWWLGGGLAIGLHALALAAGLYQGAAAYAALPITIMLSLWPLALFLRIGDGLDTRPAPPPLAALWRWLAAVGGFSYSLYLLHVPVQSLVYRLLPHLSTGPAKALLLVLWLGVVLLVSWLHFLAIERPAARLGRRLVERTRQLGPAGQAA